MKRDPLTKAVAALNTAKLGPAGPVEQLDFIKGAGIPLGQVHRLPTFVGAFGTGKSNLYLTIARAARAHHERTKK